jgi:3-dehydroquinate synthase
MADNIVFSVDPSVDLKTFLNPRKYSKVAVLTDENTLRHCYPLIQNSLPKHQVIQVKSGEEEKNIQTCSQIWQAMTDQALDRHSVLIVLGGGVLGDMGGFCAATYKRGIDFILIPTTLLSQVDASIGGKLGVDFNHFKNHIGVFQHPVLTILYSGFLKTLSARELRSGFAEIIKHMLISDSAMWDKIRSTDYSSLDWQSLTKHSVSFKQKIVSEDPKEKGLRKILNAGHTIGHALETYLLDSGNKVLHGEAIAAGLIAEGFIAREKGFLRAEAFDSICKYITKIYGKINISQNMDERIVELALQDKKNLGNRILCVLLDGIGKARWDCEISSDEVKRALAFYRSFD